MKHSCDILLVFNCCSVHLTFIVSNKYVCVCFISYITVVLFLEDVVALKRAVWFVYDWHTWFILNWCTW